MSNKKRKAVVSITVAALILALGFAGTYAWSSGDESDGEIDGTVAVSVRLHDDYDASQTGNIKDRDIYVENTGDSSLYVRIRLDEYLELGGRKLVSGSDKADKTTWKPHIMDATETIHCGAGFHDYFKWEMGNQAPIDYASDVKNWYTGGQPAKTLQSGVATIITMSDYMNAPDNAKPTDCWIVDEKDGYAYWSTQLVKDTATGLLLNGIEVSTDLDESYLYKLNAKLEAVTEIDVTSWINDAETTDGKKMNRASENAAKFLKDISPSYIKITAGMNLTTPPASDFDGDRDGYLTKTEYKQYGKATGTVRISETTFPDAIFRNYVETNLDTDGNGFLTPDELQAVVMLDVSHQGIADLKGIENFTSLTDLDCSYNKLISVKLNNNTSLTTVAADNQTAELKLDYGTGATTYRSQKGLFETGTTFGASDIVMDAGTGGIEMKAYTTGKTSTFSAPLTYGTARISSNLTGTLTFKVDTTKDVVNAAEPGDVINLINQDGSLTEWAVLTKTASQAELMTKEPITKMNFASVGINYPKWSASAVRTYLNGTYLNTLSTDVRNTIKEETNLVTPTSYLDFSLTETTSDKIYLLCEGGTSGTGTRHVITPSGKNLSADTTLKEFLKCSITALDGSYPVLHWWLRSPTLHAQRAGVVDRHLGVIYWCNVDTAWGVRPAMTLNLQ